MLSVVLKFKFHFESNSVAYSKFRQRFFNSRNKVECSHTKNTVVNVSKINFKKPEFSNSTKFWATPQFGNWKPFYRALLAMYFQLFTETWKKFHVAHILLSFHTSRTTESII